MGYFWGIAFIVAGILLIWKTYAIVNFFGESEWANRVLGSTYTMYKLIGIILIVLSVLFMFGFAGFVLSPFRGIFGGGP